MSESLLARDVPKLQSNECIVIPINYLECKVNTNSRSVIVGEKWVNVSFDEGGFTGSKFTDDQNFEQIFFRSNCSRRRG